MTRFGPSPFLASSISATLVASILWVLTLAALPHLHEEVHHHRHAEENSEHEHGDAEHGEGTEHECAVTLFQQGSIEGAPTVVFVSVPVFCEISAVDLIHSAEVAAIFLLSSVLEHAPPFFS